jgi:hypothetical protein
VRVIQKSKPEEIKPIFRVTIPTEKLSRTDSPLIRHSGEQVSTHNRSSVMTTEPQQVHQHGMTSQSWKKEKMSFVIYVDPTTTKQDIFECPDDNPKLHENCKQAYLYARQHVFFLSEQVEHLERFAEKLTHLNVAQELALRQIDKLKSQSVPVAGCNEFCSCQNTQASDSDIVTMDFADYSKIMRYLESITKENEHLRAEIDAMLALQV